MEITLKDAMQAGVHFGHAPRYWNPKMKPYIFGKREGLHIIDAEQTIPALRNACDVVNNLAQESKQLLFIGTKRVASKIIKEQAQRIGMPYVDKRWLGGMLTNYKTLRASIRKLEKLREKFELNEHVELSKKEALGLQRKMDKLEHAIGGIAAMESLPDALFIVDVNYERIAVLEGNKLQIPIIGIVDTNSSPEGIDYVIPGNDDAERSVEYFVTTIADAFDQGKFKLNPDHALEQEGYAMVTE